VTLSVDTSKTFQRIIGFGGAFTEAAAHNLKLMSTAKQEVSMFSMTLISSGRCSGLTFIKEIMNAYFGPTGNYYSIGRIPMNSCDFSIASYRSFHLATFTLPLFSVVLHGPASTTRLAIWH